MTTAWTRTAGAICTEALQNLGIQDSGSSIPPEDMQTALDALDAVLKELPLYGYSWPKLSVRTSLAWTTNPISLPSDYFGYLRVWANGIPLREMSVTVWNNLTNNVQFADTAPTSFYVDPSNALNLYPQPSFDPLITVQYQRIVDDVAQGQSVDLPQYWNNALGWGVALELGPKFRVPEQELQRIEKMWMQKMTRALGNSVANGPISFDVADDRGWDPQNWQAPVPIPDGFDAGN